MATSRKVTSKHAKSKDAQPAQPPTHTASGRQQQLPKKENYRISESQHITHRQENKEKKLDKQKKKALRAAYEADPNGFKQELSKLHSDIDREEETMIYHDMLSKLSQSKLKVLTFSAGKIPLATRKTTTTDRTDDEDNNNIAKELSPIVQGSKHPLDVTLDDAMVLPKIKKNPDGSRHHMKASDFDDVSKEILVMATSIF
ncbi:hypothetical protein BDR03DRAFT_979683 [Suillus americanus]|nr:hypothetical protein BDR03DRAFT_979683 [Suillus americanus]